MSVNSNNSDISSEELTSEKAPSLDATMDVITEKVQEVSKTTEQIVKINWFSPDIWDQMKKLNKALNQRVIQMWHGSPNHTPKKDRVRQYTWPAYINPKSRC